MNLGWSGAGPKGSPGLLAAHGFPGFRPKRLQPRPPDPFHQIEKGKGPGLGGCGILESGRMRPLVGSLREVGSVREGVVPQRNRNLLSRRNWSSQNRLRCTVGELREIWRIRVNLFSGCAVIEGREDGISSCQNPGRTRKNKALRSLTPVSEFPNHSDQGRWNEGIDGSAGTVSRLEPVPRSQGNVSRRVPMMGRQDA